MRKYFVIAAAFWGLLSTVSATTINVAPQARVSASTEAPGFPASAVTDGCIRLMDAGEWRSSSSMTPWGQIDYPRIRLDWDTIQRINRVVLYDSKSLDRHVAGVTLHFSDSTRIDVNSIDNGGAPRTVDFEPRNVSWLEIEVTDADGISTGLSEVEVYTSVDGTSGYVGRVNPYIETARGRYFFFVTGSLPFGMISAAPLTRNKNQYGGGYNYNSTDILGFPQLHDWMMGALVMMPVTGAVDPSGGDESWKSPFSHDGEIVRPGYHRLYLDRYDMWVEQTATDRVAMYRCTSTDTTSTSSVILGLQGYVGTTTMVNPRLSMANDSTLTGELTTVGRLWGGPDSVKVYFAVRFDRPVRSLDSWSGGRELTRNVDSFESNDVATRRFPGEYFSYWDAPAGGVVARLGEMSTGESALMKISVSYVGCENALENMERECSGWDFDEVSAEAQRVWDRQLGRIDVEGGTPAQQEKFYTDLWHVLLGRHKINDFNGEYPDYTHGRRDGAFTRDIDFKVRKLPMNSDGSVRFNMYNSDAFWLTQWNLNVLWGLAWPEVLDDFAACMVQYAENGGLLPRGPNAGGYSYIMTGCPATPLIVSAYQKGQLTKVDAQTAYRHMVANHRGGGMLGTPQEIDFYETHGYIPDNAGITLETAFQDWSLASMAERMGKKKDARRYNRRASGWTALYNPAVGLLMPRTANGNWLHDNPLDGWGWVEANAWQATWSVSHQLDRLAELMGGRDSMAMRLDKAFTMAATEDFVSGYSSGYVSYANQPGLSNAHVFNRIGHGHLAQKWVRRVQSQAYGYTSPDRGYGGHDEDQGQMGAMSALMAMGLFSVTGTAGIDPVYDVTTPIFEKITVNLPSPYYNDSQLIIETRGNVRDNWLIKKADFNGKSLDPEKMLLRHADIAGGGTLTITVDD